MDNKPLFKFQTEHSDGSKQKCSTCGEVIPNHPDISVRSRHCVQHIQTQCFQFQVQLDGHLIQTTPEDTIKDLQEQLKKVSVERNKLQAMVRFRDIQIEGLKSEKLNLEAKTHNCEKQLASLKGKLKGVEGELEVVKAAKQSLLESYDELEWGMSSQKLDLSASNLTTAFLEDTVEPSGEEVVEGEGEEVVEGEEAMEE
ncbi:hypothetical protein CAEBREN_03881 [Caenorhabditis brenneri]|uniref:Uncharacterized protein n=1 Tax=Caenorhabditis brenneri TaxID=135651 RepID=G0PEV3_CAEBE|nr:hypothetical protein CAEBREN_03881 [Caenorhabditis brenneri]